MLAWTLAACGKSPTSPGPGNGGGGSSTAGSFSGVLNGEAWASGATLAFAQTDLPGRMTLVGVGPIGGRTGTLTITLGFITGTGTFPLGVNYLSNGGGGALFAESPQSATWTTLLDGASGTITVTSVTASRIAGTFQFTAAPGTGTSGTKTAANGLFDLPFRTSFTPAPQSGSRISATINGGAWNAATIAATASGMVLGFGGGNTVYNLSVAARVFTAGSTYPLTTGPDGVRLTIIGQAPGVIAIWGGAGGDTGSFTVTTFGGGRATGTFSGTLAPQGQTAGGPLVITNGSFDVRFD
jgi:hypothetical protein